LTWKKGWKLCSGRNRAWSILNMSWNLDIETWSL
jgi:hypothetical protein